MPLRIRKFFPLLKENKIWLGNGFKGNVGFFSSPYEDKALASEHRDGLIRVSGVMWFTNIDLCKRHKTLLLDTMEHNLKFNKRLRKKLEKEYGVIEYPHYDNYDAINVPFTDAIPSDYDGVMGVPITFMDKYNPEQFDIVAFRKGEDGKDLVFTRERERESSTVLSYPCTTSIAGLMNNPKDTKVHGKSTYARITIKRKLSQ